MVKSALDVNGSLFGLNLISVSSPRALTSIGRTHGLRHAIDTVLHPGTRTVALLDRTMGDDKTPRAHAKDAPELHGNNRPKPCFKMRVPLDTVGESIHVVLKSKRALFLSETTTSRVSRKCPNYLRSCPIETEKRPDTTFLDLFAAQREHESNSQAMRLDGAARLAIA